MAMDGESLLSSRSGMLVMFGKSLHSINHYWFRTRYISRTVFGCFVLKFIGSTLISLVLLGRPPSWYSEQHHVTSFLLAFCMVRSDALEAKELSGHMRYAAPATIALNFVAALQKMRSLVSLVEKRHEIGWVAVLGFGTLAFSACNALMVAEAYCLRRAATRPAASEVERQLLLQALAIAPTVRQAQQRHERHERSASSPMSAWSLVRDS